MASSKDIVSSTVKLNEFQKCLTPLRGLPCKSQYFELSLKLHCTPNENATPDSMFQFWIVGWSWVNGLFFYWPLQVFLLNLIVDWKLNCRGKVYVLSKYRQWFSLHSTLIRSSDNPLSSVGPEFQNPVQFNSVYSHIAFYNKIVYRGRNPEPEPPGKQSGE